MHPYAPLFPPRVRKRQHLGRPVHHYEAIGLSSQGPCGNPGTIIYPNSKSGVRSAVENAFPLITLGG